MKPLWLAIRLPDDSPPSSLACWAGAFTPRLSLAENALLLEIGGCLRLFGGAEVLRGQVERELAGLGIAARTGLATTPQAALWLTEGGGDSLDALPLAALSWPAGVAEKLTRFGLRRLGELRRLTSPQGAGRHDQPEGRRTPRPARRAQDATEWRSRAKRGMGRSPTSGGPERSEGWGEAPQVAVPSNARDGATPHSFQALARRIGKEAATMIARAYGEAPDPRPEFVFPPRFEQEIELPAAVENAPVLLFAARRLTGALAGWLNVRQAGLRECRLDLVQRQGATPLPLRFAESTRDASRFERVLRERLDRLRLAAPVESLRLVVDSVEALPGASGGLFDEGKAKESMAALVERLRARLGEERVYGIAPVADHRPECATCRNQPADKKPLKKHAGPPQVFLGSLGGGHREAAASGGGLFPPRPLWLLARPESLAEVAGRPHWHGPLTLLAGPERIESGWWDQEEGTGDIRRDYFVGLTSDGRWAWVFRELRLPGGWYLHGWFG